VSATIIEFPGRPAGRVPDRARDELADVLGVLEEHGPKVAAALARLGLVKARVERHLAKVDEDGFMDAIGATGLQRALELAWTIADTAQEAAR
jgi:hypothetical protein